MSELKKSLRTNYAKALKLGKALKVCGVPCAEMSHDDLFAALGWLHQKERNAESALRRLRHSLFVRRVADDDHVNPPGIEAVSPTTTWVCPACGRWYQTLRKRDELPTSAERRCIEQHIEEGCRKAEKRIHKRRDKRKPGREDSSATGPQ